MRSPVRRLVNGGPKLVEVPRENLGYDGKVAGLFEEALSKSTASRICGRLRADFDAFRTRDLGDLDIDYLFLDGRYRWWPPLRSTSRCTVDRCRQITRPISAHDTNRLAFNWV